MDSVCCCMTGASRQAPGQLTCPWPRKWPRIPAFVDRAVVYRTCPDCEGTRLAPHARESKIRGISIADACAMQISDLAA